MECSPHHRTISRKIGENSRLDTRNEDPYVRAREKIYLPEP